MKNLKHIQIEQEEKRAGIKSIDEHEWSDGDIVNVAHYESGFEIELCVGTSYTAINDEDLAVLANARGFDLVKREGKR